MKVHALRAINRRNHCDLIFPTSNFRPMTNRPISSLKTVLLILIVLASPNLLGQSKDDPGQKIFSTTCASCHGENGSPTPVGESLYAPDLREDEVQRKSDGDLQKIVSEGVNSMPSFKGTLPPKDIQSVVGYLRELAKKK